MRALRPSVPRTRRRSISGSLGAGVLALSVAGSWAAPPRSPAPASPSPAQWHAVDSGRGALSLDQAVAIAERQYRARVVRASVADAPHKTYVLRLLSTEGRVWTVHVDADTGTMN